MKLKTTRIDLGTLDGASFHDVSEEIWRYVAMCGIDAGLCVLTVSHPSCALALVEETDEDFDELIRLARELLRARTDSPPVSDGIDDPPRITFPSAVLTESLTLPVRGGRISAGSWDTVLLLEGSGPANRHIDVTVLGI